MPPDGFGLTLQETAMPRTPLPTTPIVYEDAVSEDAVSEDAVSKDAPADEARSDDARWAAVAERNPRLDGSFVYSVVTTGVYCRPSCPGRPKWENVRFHATWAEAEAAGFRPCKRCKPKGEPSP
jgi:AraC family transcriptional regulator of adaptative response/methylated-DNA-[protein]-cysteine methyltransferase